MLNYAEIQTGQVCTLENGTTTLPLALRQGLLHRIRIARLTNPVLAQLFPRQRSADRRILSVSPQHDDSPEGTGISKASFSSLIDFGLETSTGERSVMSRSVLVEICAERLFTLVAREGEIRSTNSPFCCIRRILSATRGDLRRMAVNPLLEHLKVCPTFIAASHF